MIRAASKVEEEPQSAGVLLLRDIADIFETRRVARINSSDLLAALIELEESPWSEWRGGTPISPRGIAKLLKPYGIKPRHDSSSRFYGASDFKDAFARYLTEAPKKSVTSVTSVTQTASVTDFCCKNNGDDACDTYDANSEVTNSIRHAAPTDDGFEGEI